MLFIQVTDNSLKQKNYFHVLSCLFSHILHYFYSNFKKFDPMSNDVNKSYDRTYFITLFMYNTHVSGIWEGRYHK